MEWWDTKFDWGQIIEEVFDADPAADSEDAADPASLAVRWNVVLSDVHSAFLYAGGNLGELSDIATMLLAHIEDSRHELPEAEREDAMPALIAFDEGNNISAFAVGVVGRSNVVHARVDGELLHPGGAADSD